MERSHPTSGRPATPADINRNGRPTSIGTSGRHQSECPADIIGMRSYVGRHWRNSHPNEPNFIGWSDRLAHLERKAREANGTSSRWRLRLGVFRRLGEFILVFSQHLWRMVVFGIAVTVLRDIGKAA